MANNYYNFPVPFIAGTKVRSDQVNTQYQGIESGFDLLSTDPAASIIGTTFFGTDVQGATVNEYLITTPDPNTPLVNGQRVSFFATHSNNGAVTLNVDGSGLVAGVNLDGDSVVSGQIISGQFYEWVYDNANTQWLVTKGISGITDPLLLSNGTVGAPTYSFELDPDTGMFQNGANILGFAAGGFLPVQVDASNGAGNLQLIVTPGGPQNNATFPALAFGDGDTGIYEPSDDQLSLSLGAVDRWFWSGNIYGSLLGAGPAMLNEAASATNPTLVPDRSDSDTGLGQNAAGEPSLIGNGVELARGVAAGSGGLQANNTLTGGGLERVLTVSDAFTGTIASPIRVLTDINTLTPPTTEAVTGAYEIWDADDTDILQRLGYEGSNTLQLRNFMHGGPVTISGENAAGVTTLLVRGDPDGITELFAAGVCRFEAQSLGKIAVRSDGNTDAEDRQLVFDHQDTSDRGRIGYIGDDILLVKNEIHGGNVKLQAEDIAGVVRQILEGDPDASTVVRGDTTVRLQHSAGTLGVEVGTSVDLYQSGVLVAQTLAAAAGGLQANNTLTGAGIERVLTTGDIPGGGVGNVTKVGTPVDNEIGVWTGDGTIEGDTNFTWDGSEQRMTGVIRIAERAASLADVAGFGQIWINSTPNPNTLHYTDEIGTDIDLTRELWHNGVLRAQASLGAVNFPNTAIFVDSNVYIEEGLSAGVDVPTYGQFWVRDDAPGQTPMWTDDAGTDFVLNAAGGGGDVTKVGTPVDNQVGVWTGDGTIEGTTGLTYNGTAFEVTGSIQVANGSGGLLVNEGGSATNPTLVARKGDLDTGVGTAGDDRLSLISGGVSGIQLIEASGGVFIKYDAEVTITAFAGGGIGSATELHQSYNVVTTVATTGDSVKLSEATRVGMVVYVKNDGANALDLFPSASDDLGFGVGTAISVAAGQSVAFIGTVDNNTWTQLIFSKTVGAGDVFKVGTPVNNQIGVWTGDGTIEGDANFTWDGSQLSLPTGTSAGAPELKIGPGQTGLFSGSSTQLRITTDGTERFTITSNRFQGFLAGSGIVHNQVSSATVPGLSPNTNAPNMGLGLAGTDEMSIIAGGVQIAQAKEAVGANQFIVAPGVIQDAEATPSLALGDGDTGFYEEVDDTIAVALGGNKEFEFAPVGDPSFSSVELLSDNDGPDGATTYTERSLNAASATFVGNSELDTAQFKFGTASMLFDGTGDYASYPDGTFELGSSAWTIEGWVRLNTLPSDSIMSLVSQWEGAGSDRAYNLFLRHTTAFGFSLGFEWRDDFSGFESGSIDPVDPVTGQWFHFAVQRGNNDVGDELTIWWDGAREFNGGGPFVGAIDNSTVPIKLGVRDPGAGGGAEQFLDGWLDDVRITVGVTRYDISGDISVPIAAFPTNSGEFTGAAVGAGKLFNTVASLTSPTLVPRNDDDDTGIGGDGTDVLAIIAGGAEGMRFTELNDGVISAPAASLAVTAFATGGQGSATQLDNGSNVLGTVATTGDSVKLPPVFAANSVVYVKNDGANAADIFPATGDNLGAGLNTAVSIPAGSSMSFIATVANATWTQWIVDTFGAGDVTKVGTPVNNQVGVWTGDGTIEGDTNFQFNGSQLLLLDGTAAAPSYSWVSDPDTGVYRFSTNRLGFAAGGSAVAVMNSSEFSGLVAGGPAMRLNAAASSTVPVLIPNVTTDSDTGIGWSSADALSLIAGGVEMARFVEAVGIEQTLILNNDNTGLPDLGSLGDPDTGFNWDVANGLYTVQGGIRQWNWSSTSYFGQNSGGPLLSNVLSSSTVPTICPTRADILSGLGGTNAGEVHLIANSVTGLTVKELNGGILQVPASSVAVTAFATGGQANAVTLWDSYNVVSVCATTGDSVKLPSAFAVGSIHFIKNDGAASCDVFPANGDDLGAGLNTAVAVLPGQSVSFIGIAASTTWTQLLVDTSGGDVFKVGTTASQQVGFWTGDGTLDGTTEFRWDGFDIINAGSGGLIRGSSVRAGAIINETGSATNPTLLPNKDDLDSGFGAAAADQLSIIAGGVEMLRATEAGTSATDQIFLPRDGAAATPALALGATNHGFFTGGVAQLNAVVSGVTKFFVNSSAFTVAGASMGVDLATGPRMFNEVASGTNPTLVPNQNDVDTGLGWNAAGEPSLVGNGVELARGVAAASGGLQANNADTGGGLERVLTESDLVVAFPEFQFFADQLENPVTADWTVNALAPAAADSNNSGLTVRLFDDTAEEGVGFIVEVPTGATNIVFDFVARAETAPGAVNTVGLDIYNRGIPDNAAVQAWSASTALTDISIPTNEFFQEDTQSVALSTLGVTAGETTQFELVRTLPGAGTDLTGDWAMLLVKVSFT